MSGEIQLQNKSITADKAGILLSSLVTTLNTHSESVIDKAKIESVNFCRAQNINILSNVLRRNH